jgi:four helix bundle protein
MNIIDKRKYNIYGRIFKFVISVIKLTKLLPKTEENKVIISQLLRSATSMGANSEEADGSSTAKDFLHCFTTVRKEGKESIFWLKLLFELNVALQPKIVELIKEGGEITAIISKIIFNSRLKKKNVLK